MPKKISARGVKTHRTYRFDQLAEIVGVTVATVRSWCKKGLPCITDQRPFLIRGRDFKVFHEAHLKSRRQKLAPFEVYCLSCKRPVQPL
jgi:transposase